MQMKFKYGFYASLYAAGETDDFKEIRHMLRFKLFFKLAYF